MMATGACLVSSSVTGHDDQIARPVAEAVPLFWRFMIEKFGVDPEVQPSPRPSSTR